MKKIVGRLAGALLALVLTSGLAAAQSKVTVAIGGRSEEHTSELQSP